MPDLVPATRLLAKRVQDSVHKEMEQHSVKVSCTQGCAGCCYLFVVASLPEAAVLAEHLYENEALLARFEAQKEKHLDLLRRVGCNARAYQSSKTPCIFLDTESNTCVAYDARPSACSLYYVKSDPRLCGSTSEKIVALNTQSARKFLYTEHDNASRQLKLPLGGVPLVVGVTWGLHLLREGVEAWTDAFAGLPEDDVLSPAFWEKAAQDDREREQRRIHAAKWKVILVPAGTVLYAGADKKLAMMCYRRNIADAPNDRYVVLRDNKPFKDSSTRR